MHRMMKNHEHLLTCHVIKCLLFVYEWKKCQSLLCFFREVMTSSFVDQRVCSFQIPFHSRPGPVWAGGCGVTQFSVTFQIL